MTKTKRENLTSPADPEFSVFPVANRFYSFWTAHRQRITLVALMVIAFGIGATGYYFYDRYSSLGQDPGSGAQQEADALIAQVGRLMVLPEGEQPTIATVSDPERLRDQPFFAKAKIGDKVLIYTNARRAILYDPVADKIVEVAPINLGEKTTPNPSPGP